MTRIYSAFDPAHLGPDMVLSNSNQTVTYLTNGDSKSRTARCLFPLSAFTNMVEFLVYAAPGTSPTLTGNCSVGIVNASASLSTYVGGDTNGYGFLPAEGKVYNNGASVLTTSATCALGDIIGMIAALDGATPSINFYKNGNPIGSVTLTAGATWYIGASVGGATAQAMLVFMDAGQSSFQYPNASSTGWWVPTPQLNPVYLSGEDFMSLPTDSNPNIAYDGAINPQNSSSLAISRGVSFWPWRTSTASLSSGTSYGSITLDDPQGLYDLLVMQDVRDQVIALSRAPIGTSVDSAQALCAGVIDHVETSGDFGKIIYLKDNLALLDGMTQHGLFLPNVDPSAASKPRPLISGACRSVPATLVNTTTNQYAFNDAPILQLPTIRVAGKILTAGTDYTQTPDGTGILFASTPAGLITADAAAGLTSVPAGATDVLTGNGNFASFTLNSQVTANWTYAYAGDASALPSFAVSGHGQITFPHASLAGADGILYTNTAVIGAGNSYLCEITIDQFPNFNGANYLFLDGDTGAQFQMYPWGSLYYAGTGGTGRAIQVVAPTTISIVLTNTTGSNLPLALKFDNGYTASPGPLKISNVVLYLIPSATSVAALTGQTLTQYFTDIMVHGGIDSSTWSAADTTAIDTACGYSSLGNFINTATSVRNVLQPALDSYCADLFDDRSGLIRTVQLVDPATVTPSGIIGENVILGQLNANTNLETGLSTSSAQESMIGIMPDLAPGLTTRFGARRNWQVYTAGDFQSTSLTDCPANVRALLQQQFQIITASGQQLSQTYIAANQALPLPSLFDSQTDAQTENDRVCKLYTVLRNFYFVPVKSDFSDSYEIGQVWTLQYPRYGLAAGKSVMIVGISENPINEQLTLTCWG